MGRTRSNPGSDDALIEAIRHPLRRSLLQRWIESDEERSPSDFAKAHEEPVEKVAYHVRELEALGALELVSEEPIRGSVKHFYMATEKVKTTPWLLAVLGVPSPN